MEGITLREWPSTQLVLAQYADWLWTNFKNQIPEQYRIKPRLTFKITQSDTQWELEFSGPDYYKWIENGRGPGRMPPRDKILDWIIDRKIEPYPSRNGRLPTKESLAYLIARKIGKVGIPAKKYMSNTVAADAAADWGLRIANAIGEDFTRNIDATFVVFEDTAQNG